MTAPKQSDTPSAYFAVKPPDAREEEPNMKFVDIVVQSTSGVTIVPEKGNVEMAELLSPLASVVEKGDTIMGFEIKVLVIGVPLTKEVLLTKPHVDKAKRPKEAAKAITTQQVLKKMKTS